MTPAEMCVLFSSYVVAFLLVWLTDFAERPRFKSQAAKTECQTYPAVQEKLKEEHEHTIWDVRTFFGLNT